MRLTIFSILITALTIGPCFSDEYAHLGNWTFEDELDCLVELEQSGEYETHELYTYQLDCIHAYQDFNTEYPTPEFLL
jgi:hypothetical protein